MRGPRGDDALGGSPWSLDTPAGDMSTKNYCFDVTAARTRAAVPIGAPADPLVETEANIGAAPGRVASR